DAHAEGSQSCPGQIRDVVLGTAIDGQRHRRDRAQIMIGAAVEQAKPTLSNTAGRSASRAMLAQARAVGIQCKPSDGRYPAVPLGKSAHLCAEHGVIRIQHQKSVRRDDRSDYKLYFGQGCEVVYSVLTKVIRADVGNQGYLRLRYSYAPAQDTPTRGLENR